MCIVITIDTMFLGPDMMPRYSSVPGCLDGDFGAWSVSSIKLSPVKLHTDPGLLRPPRSDPINLAKHHWLRKHAKSAQSTEIHCPETRGSPNEKESHFTAFVCQRNKTHPSHQQEEFHQPDLHPHRLALKKASIVFHKEAGRHKSNKYCNRKTIMCVQ